MLSVHVTFTGEPWDNGHTVELTGVMVQKWGSHNGPGARSAPFFARHRRKIFRGIDWFWLENTIFSAFLVHFETRSM